MKQPDYTVTTTGNFPKQKPRFATVKRFFFIIRWLWKHRDERDCRQKLRRMERELSHHG
jgi:hypothetical protein